MKSKHKKSAPVSTPVNQLNSTTPSARSHADFLFDLIGTGREHAVKRPGKGNEDRKLRKLVTEANMNGDCIINNGKGYYRPGIDDAEEYRAYRNSELHRAKEIVDKIARMDSVYYGGTYE